MEAEVYKKLLNFNFLNDLFNENEDFVLKLYKDFDDENAILMEESVKKLNDGRVLFAWVFTIKIN